MRPPSPRRESGARSALPDTQRFISLGEETREG